MSARRRRAAAPKVRYCALCGGAMSDLRPVYLVAEQAGAITGPFHAGCAERLAIAAQSGRGMPSTPGATNYGVWPTSREETVPW